MNRPETQAVLSQTGVTRPSGEKLPPFSPSLQTLGTAALLAQISGVPLETAAASLKCGLRGLLLQSSEEASALGHVQRGLLSALELSRRLAAERSERPRLQSPESIFRHVQPHFVGLEREQMHVLCLSARQQLLAQQVVAEGAVDQCVVDPREVWAPALRCKASGVVLVHNHPSQDPEPSLQDVRLTEQMQRAGLVLGIRLVDSLVVTDSRFVSLAQRGLFERFDTGDAKCAIHPTC
jgi:DNA repair protein RadC